MAHSQAEYDEAIASPEWGSRVIDQLRRYLSEGQWLLQPVESFGGT